MQHLEPEDLTLLALGESVGPRNDASAHLAGCGRCSAELNQLRMTAQLARESDPRRSLGRPDPPAGVWERIAAELDHPLEGSSPVSQAPLSRLRRSSRGNAIGRRAGTARPERWRLVALGIAAAVIGAAATLGITRPWSDPAPAAVVTVAQATLTPLLPGGSSSGTVRVISRDGYDVLVVHAKGLPLISGYYQVWLFNPKSPQQMQSAGDLTANSSGEFTLPEGLNLETFSGVDISAEQYDGNTAHSAVSVLRGALTN